MHTQEVQRGVKGTFESYINTIYYFTCEHKCTSSIINNYNSTHSFDRILSPATGCLFNIFKDAAIFLAFGPFPV